MPTTQKNKIRKTKSQTKKKQTAPGWPYYKLFTLRQIIESRIREMQRLKFQISRQPRKPLALNLKTTTIQPTFKGKYTTFVDDNYLKYDILPLVYSEPELLKCQFRGQPAPITQYAARANQLWQEFQTKQLQPKKGKTLKIQTIARQQQTQSRVLSEYREFLYSKIKACNNYRPTLALQTYKFLGPAKSVLDFSAGWGDRLFAACVGQIKYIGLDPNINNRGVYDTIIRNHGSSNRQRVITTGAEYLPTNTLTLNMSELGIPEFDLIATSPPFYDYEVYSDTAQSAMGFIDAPRWLIFWLGQVVYKYIPFLRTGGYFALYLQDTDKNSFVEPLTLFILSNPTMFSNLECCGIINSTRFPMVVFQKPKSNPRTETKSITTQTQTQTQKYQNLLQTNYPTHAKLAELWLTTHDSIQDINTDSLTRTVVKYLINKTGQQVCIPNTQAYSNLAEEFQTNPNLHTTPDKLDKLFIDLWRESIQEYKLIFGHTPETNIHPPEYRAIYTKLFNSG
jgi:hypothetical protein